MQDSRRDRMVAEPHVPYGVTVRRTSSGVFLGVAGAVAGLLAAGRMLTLLPSLVLAATDCTPSEMLGATELRVGLVVALVAGGIAFALSDMGVRREMPARWIGVAGSVLGIFSLLGSGVLLALTFLGGMADCIKQLA